MKFQVEKTNSSNHVPVNQSSNEWTITNTGKRQFVRNDSMGTYSNAYE